MENEPGGSVELPWHSKEFPWFLNLHWQTLLGLSIFEWLIEWLPGRYYNWETSTAVALNVVPFAWSIMQAAWLRKVRPDSTVLYWYTASFLLHIVSWADKLNHARSYSGDFVDLLRIVVEIAGIFAMRLYMLRYFYETERLDLRMNRWLTFFFNVFYFQYKFNEVAKSKRQHALDVAPVTQHLTVLRVLSSGCNLQ